MKSSTSELSLSNTIWPDECPCLQNEIMVNQDMVWKPYKVFYLFVHVYANLRMAKTVKWANSKHGRRGGGEGSLSAKSARGLEGSGTCFTENILYSVWNF